jgi:hypothetical protein
MSDSITPQSTEITPDRRSRRRRGLAIGLVVAGAIAAAPGVATLAGFTAQDVNRDNSIQSGTLDVAFGQDEKHFDVRNMKPGDKTAQKVEIVNTGTLTEDFVLDAVNVQGTLDDVLRVTVARDGRVLLADSKLSEMDALVGSLGSGEFATYEVAVAWPENAPEIDNTYQGGLVSFDMQVDADQLPGQQISNGDNAGN